MIGKARELFSKIRAEYQVPGNYKLDVWIISGNFCDTLLDIRELTINSYFINN